MKSISLHGKKGEGLFLLCDDDDYLLLSKFKWYLCHGYAKTVVHNLGTAGKGRATSAERQLQLMAHRIVLDSPPGSVTDHKNRNRLDCRKDNLRSVTYGQNSLNVGRPKPESGYWGVVQDSTNSFCAMYHRTRLGFFPTATLAALARDKEVRRCGHEYVDLNFPDIDNYDDVIRQPPRTTHERSSNTVGVSYSHTRRAKEKWRAVRKKKHIGWFFTEDEAIAALRKHDDENTIRRPNYIRRTRPGLRFNGARDGKLST